MPNALLDRAPVSRVGTVAGTMAPRSRVARTARVGASLALAAGLGLAAVATATSAFAHGSVTLSQATDLDPAGAQVVVTGTGFDEAVGIYVALCVDNGPDAEAGPCVGGADMTGQGGASAWVSSNPPAYAQGLTTPYGAGGTFEVTLTLTAADPVSGVDCRTQPCAVTTRADHTNPDNRTQDTHTAVSFAAGDADPASSTPPASEPPATTPPPLTGTAQPTQTSGEAATPTGVTGTDGIGTTDSSTGSSDGGSPLVWLIGGGVVLIAAVAWFALRRRSDSAAGNGAI